MELVMFSIRLDSYQFTASEKSSAVSTLSFNTRDLSKHISSILLQESLKLDEDFPLSYSDEGNYLRVVGTARKISSEAPPFGFIDFS